MHTFLLIFGGNYNIRSGFENVGFGFELFIFCGYSIARSGYLKTYGTSLYPYTWLVVIILQSCV